MLNKIAVSLISVTLSVCILSTMAFAAGKYYRLYDDGGEHAADTCQVVTMLPSKLSKTHFKTKFKTFLGSEQIEFASKNEAGIDAYEHYFSNAADCQLVVKQLQKEYGY